MISIAPQSSITSISDNPWQDHIAKKTVKHNGEIDFEGFLKILNAKLVNQSPLVNGQEEPLDAMKEMAQMMTVQHTSRQVDLMNNLLQEVKSLKTLLLESALPEQSASQHSILNTLEHMDHTLASLQNNTPLNTFNDLSSTSKDVPNVINKVENVIDNVKNLFH